MIWTAAAAVFAMFCFSALYAGLSVRRYAIRSGKVAAPLRLAVVADLHSTRYGEGQRELIRAIRSERPDAVLFVGDIVDDKRPEEPAMALFRALGGEFPCYYVSGNHEFLSGRQAEVKAKIRSFGVTVLEGGAASLVAANGQALAIAGADDPAFWGGYSTFGGYSLPGPWLEQFRAAEASAAESGGFSVLLSHRPELVDIYGESGFDLVLSGHAHGGQARIPGVMNGLFAPCQGWFPKYAGGLYDLSGTALLVSRGLCRNGLPRVFNPPELVLVEISPKT